LGIWNKEFGLMRRFFKDEPNSLFPITNSLEGLLIRPNSQFPIPNSSSLLVYHAYNQ
jgi:hypothetical protein